MAQFDKVKDVVPQSRQFLTEVWSELRKVHWPTRQETVAATVVVLVVVAIVSLWLSLVDGVLSFFFTRFLGT
jgi:preprotein translocase subunit SecE